MANPQKENGHVDIANEIVDQFCKYRIPGQEWQVLWVIFRKTWGWKKKKDCIPLSQIAQATQIDRRKISSLLNSLHSKNIITKGSTNKGASTFTTYGIQKNYELWRVAPIKATGTNKGDKVAPIRVSKLAPIKVPSKEKKETIQKKYSPISFEMRTSESLFSLILRRNRTHKKPNFQTWARHIERMIKIDGRSEHEIEKVMIWSQKDMFWQNNILSTESLRRQFDKLKLKMGGNNGASRRDTKEDERAFKEWDAAEEKRQAEARKHRNIPKVIFPRDENGEIIGLPTDEHL